MGVLIFVTSHSRLSSQVRVKHKVATPYHPQTSGQVELANWEIKNILMKSMAKHVISPLKWNTKAWWEIKKLNMDLSKAGMKRFSDLNEMEELRNDALQQFKHCKTKIERWHDELVSLEVKMDRPIYIQQVYSNGVVELLNSNNIGSFKVNGQRLKPFMEPFSRDRGGNHPP
ncbi:hypothetical protein CK203_019345 [Vitis vinifera]|uniref:Integrase catalytic domain-containing protein n=1 Tax=Vitis vinifera TaxID=29760 RepID=A0A438IYY2_VITVI|nr:hypothetical protein CK203_019345 [Vitis vinifera]